MMGKKKMAMKRGGKVKGKKKAVKKRGGGMLKKRGGGMMELAGGGAIKPKKKMAMGMMGGGMAGKKKQAMKKGGTPKARMTRDKLISQKAKLKMARTMKPSGRITSDDLKRAGKLINKRAKGK